MERKEKRFFENKRKVVLILLIVIIILVLVLYFFIKTDGMEQTGIKNLSYRTYSKEKGWSKWSKNGIISGDKINPITSIETKGREGEIELYTYEKRNGWSDKKGYKYKETKKRDSIRGIKIGVYYELAKDYDVCYRTYNKKDKWLEWTCSANSKSGNKKEEITGIEMKVIPKNVIKYDYLKDYKKKEKINKGFDKDE